MNDKEPSLDAWGTRGREFEELVNSYWDSLPDNMQDEIRKFYEWKAINKRGVYNVQEELESQGYDFDNLIDELVYQISNLGVQWEYNDEAYRGFLIGGETGWTAEEILMEAENLGVDLEEYKEEDEE